MSPAQKKIRGHLIQIQHHLDQAMTEDVCRDFPEWVELLNQISDNCDYMLDEAFRENVDKKTRKSNLRDFATVLGNLVQNIDAAREETSLNANEPLIDGAYGCTKEILIHHYKIKLPDDGETGMALFR